MTVYLVDIEFTAYRSTAAQHLDRLGWAIASTELAAVTRYAEAVPLLRVFHPALPCVGESVSAVPVPDGGAVVWWFRLSGYELLAPCDDMALVVERVYETLSPILRIVAGRRATS